MPSPRIVTLWVGLALASQACGPSFEVIQEGDLRFAHCDRLDLDGDVASSHRLTCWREWRSVYVFGQTRDRIEYAQRRIAEIVSGAEGPPFELGGDPPGTRVHVTPSTPAGAGSALSPPVLLEPTAPPPAVIPPPAPPGANAEAQPGSALERGAAQKPGDGCSVGCSRGLDECRRRCASTPVTCGACEPDYKMCMRSCFE